MLTTSSRSTSLTCALLVGLGQLTVHAATTPAAPAAPAATTATVTPAPRPHGCRDVAGLAPLLSPGSLLLLGELHGTVESPEFVGNSVCLAVAAGLAVTVALEIPREELEAIETFLTSAGEPTDRAALLTSPFWSREYQDGRSSVAMVELLATLRQLRGPGRTITLSLIDRRDMPENPQDRDRVMAETLLQALTDNPRGVVIALTGNVHSRVSRGTMWNPDYAPAGFTLLGLLADASDKVDPPFKVTALDLAYPAGTAWICRDAKASNCGAREIFPTGDGASERVEQHPEVINGHHGVYHVKSLTASPPAAGKPAPAP